MPSHGAVKAAQRRPRPCRHVVGREIEGPGGQRRQVKLRQLPGVRPPNCCRGGRGGRGRKGAAAAPGRGRQRPRRRGRRGGGQPLPPRAAQPPAVRRRLLLLRFRPPKRQRRRLLLWLHEEGVRLGLGLGLDPPPKHGDLGLEIRADAAELLLALADLGAAASEAVLGGSQARLEHLLPMPEVLVLGALLPERLLELGRPGLGAANAVHMALLRLQHRPPRRGNLSGEPSLLVLEGVIPLGCLPHLQRRAHAGRTQLLEALFARPLPAPGAGTLLAVPAAELLELEALSAHLVLEEVPLLAEVPLLDPQFAEPRREARPECRSLLLTPPQLFHRIRHAGLHGLDLLLALPSRLLLRLRPPQQRHERSLPRGDLRGAAGDHGLQGPQLRARDLLVGLHGSVLCRARSDLRGPTEEPVCALLGTLLHEDGFRTSHRRELVPRGQELEAERRLLTQDEIGTGGCSEAGQHLPDCRAPGCLQLSDALLDSPAACLLRLDALSVASLLRLRSCQAAPKSRHLVRAHALLH
mmetsp:Transcript_99345/g.318775  ORF Transcript_99345/g.318775 Transcript_99345/m.318775 type:complete len:525 (-) Transcript_99345:216-1790(-)